MRLMGEDWQRTTLSTFQSKPVTLENGRQMTLAKI